jgi:hypothetical protein
MEQLGKKPRDPRAPSPGDLVPISQNCVFTRVTIDQSGTWQLIDMKMRTGESIEPGIVVAAGDCKAKTSLSALYVLTTHKPEWIWWWYTANGLVE